METRHRRRNALSLQPRKKPDYVSRPTRSEWIRLDIVFTTGQVFDQIRDRPQGLSLDAFKRTAADVRSHQNGIDVAEGVIGPHRLIIQHIGRITRQTACSTRFGHILFNDKSAARGIDQLRSFLHRSQCPGIDDSAIVVVQIHMQR